ncbi:TPA: hypothetical protein RPW15_001483 [Campylobacter fetus subsp. venerealis]|nr:hypothetical protein [Campylobacter fetus subsp. venerealis]HDX6253964.1 hypothetical protein [Campylobacter fetus subsp. venerealis]HDX6258152.1 hypothetical protein [Campylobacter fetus subsp. venerealis]HDX6261811.1 hypothetical protein [Campylobacter fetus subsp. venerealis]HDX6263941.1 hypothetical protein [Campylobacter fetus subsp. venerealis]
MRIILVFFALINLLNAKCYKIDCTAFINQTKQETIQTVEESYRQNEEAQKELERKYAEYNEVLAIQNDLLKKIQNVKADSLLSEKNINMILEKGVRIRDKKIDEKNTEDFFETKANQ